MDLAPPVIDAPAPVPVAPGLDAAPPVPLGGVDLDLDHARAVAELADHARAFARTPPREKAALLRATLPRLLEAAPELAAAVCRVRGLDAASPAAAEAWLAGVAPVIAYVRLLAEALEDIATSGRPSLPATALYKRPEGRLVARLTPRTWAERAAQPGRETTVLFAEGTQPEDVIAAQAAFYRQSEPEGGVALVLAAGNDATAGVMDALFALFVEGKTAILAPGTLATASGRLFERALAPLVDRGFLRVAHGDAGEHLAGHPGVTSVLRAAPGDAGALLVVPCLYARDELGHLARSVAAQVAHGIAAPRVLVLPAGWLQQALFVDLLEKALAANPPHPDRADRPRWTVVPRSHGGDAREPLFSTDLESNVISLVSIGSDDPLDFLGAATDFCDERLREMRSAQITVHPIHEEDPEIGAALERAVIRLRCGAVGVNQWPALLAWAAAAPWGGHPGERAGFRHNARMLDGIDKAILHGPLLGLRRPAYFTGDPAARRIGERVAAFQAAPSLRGIWGIGGR